MNLPIQKIKRKYCLGKYPSFPTANNYHNKFFYPDADGGYLLTVESKSADGHIKNIAKEIIGLIDHLKINELIFLGDTSIEWLFQDNDFPKVREAFAYLRENKIGKTFNGGLIVSKEELPFFLKHLFWLTRCNTAFPIVHFMDNDQSIVASICQYGSLHLSSLTLDAEKQVKIFLGENSLLFPIDRCYEPFSKTGAIKGRKAIVNLKS